MLDAVGRAQIGAAKGLDVRQRVGRSERCIDEVPLVAVRERRGEILRRREFCDEWRTGRIQRGRLCLAFALTLGLLGLFRLTDEVADAVRTRGDVAQLEGWSKDGMQLC